VTGGRILGARRAAPGTAALAIGLALAGCSLTETINDATRIEYKTATQGPRLDIPPDLVTPRASERLAIPERPATGTTLSEFNRERAATGPVASSTPGVLPQAPGVRIERDGDRRWLVVDQPADKVWPVVRDFWAQSGLALRLESPETGIMETDWSEKRPPVPDSWVRNQLSRVLNSLYATAERDKFRTRLETDGKVTEVYVTHRGLVEELSGPFKETSVWVPRPSDPELEAEFLRRIMLRFTPEQKAAAAASSAAAGASAPKPTDRATLVEVDGATVLQLQEGFDRSWRQVGLALDRSGFTVEDRDRSKGTFFVRYVDPGQELKAAGALDRVFGTTPKKNLSGTRYRIAVADAAGGARVRVLDEQGNMPATESDQRVATQIVTVLRDQLR
jgi:outer membrane protein assembly factor BamC